MSRQNAKFDGRGGRVKERGALGHGLGRALHGKRRVVTSQYVEKPVDIYKIDTDLLAISYNVAAIVKGYPLLSDDVAKAIESGSYKQNQGAGENLKRAVCKMIEEHVENRKYFDIVVSDAQRRRAVDLARGTHWYDRVVVMPPNDDDDDSSVE